MRWFVLVVLVAACNKESDPAPSASGKQTPAPPPEAQEGEQPDAPEPPPEWREVMLPRAWKTWKDRADKKRIVLTLDAKGRLFCEGVHDAPISLRELGSILGERTPDVERESGNPSVGVAGEARAGAQVSVLLRVDRDAVWKHVQWVMIILAEHKIYKVWFAVQPASKVGQPSTGPASRLKAFLPTNKGISLPDQDEPETYGSTTDIVLRENGPLYRYGDRETTDVKKLYAWIKDDFAYAIKEKIRADQLYGELKAVRSAPAGAAIAAVSMYLRAGFPRVEFYGTRIPTAQERRATPFPR